MVAGRLTAKTPSCDSREHRTASRRRCARKIFRSLTVFIQMKGTVLSAPKISSIFMAARKTFSRTASVVAHNPGNLFQDPQRRSSKFRHLPSPCAWPTISGKSIRRRWNSSHNLLVRLRRIRSLEMAHHRAESPLGLRALRRMPLVRKNVLLGTAAEQVHWELISPNNRYQDAR